MWRINNERVSNPRSTETIVNVAHEEFITPFIEW